MDLTIPDQISFDHFTLDCNKSIRYLGGNKTEISYALHSKLSKKKVIISIICDVNDDLLVLKNISVDIEISYFSISAFIYVKPNFNITSDKAVKLFLLTQNIFNLINEIFDNLHENINNYKNCTERLDNELPEWANIHRFTIRD